MSETTTKAERFVIKAVAAQTEEVSFYAGSKGVVRHFDEKVCRRTKLFVTSGEADSVCMLLNRDETPGYVHTVCRIVKDKPKAEPEPDIF